MSFYKSIFLIPSVSLVFIFAGCVSQEPLPNAVYADNYSALTTAEQRTISPNNKSLSKQEIINTALAGNPGYKKAQYKADYERAKYYEALGGFSPVVSAAASTGQTGSTAGVSANYQAFSGGTTVMNVLAAQSKAEQSEWNVKDYRRKLTQNIIEQDNQLSQDSSYFNIQKANEKFQSEMAKETIQKYHKGKASKADVLNFKIQALAAKNAALTAENDYKINSYKLATSMGLTTAELPKNTEIEKVPTNDEYNKESIPGVNFYLDKAIAMRPDLKAQRDALKAAGYALYSAWGSFLPVINIGLSNSSLLLGSSLYLWKGGSRIAAVRSQEALFDIQQEILLEKWNNVVRNVRTEHNKLTTSTASKKILDQAAKTALQRRNLVFKEYNAGKTDITTLNQAQKKLIKAEQSHKQAEIDVLNAKAGLNAACGVPLF
jgi:outer membrane protein